MRSMSFPAPCGLRRWASCHHDTPPGKPKLGKTSTRNFTIDASLAVGFRDSWYVKLFCFPILVCANMLFSKEYVGYIAKQLTKKLTQGEFIETTARVPLLEKVHAALLDELTLEDRINDEVRAILEAYSSEMQKTGANYQEMFKKVKNELVRKYKAVL